MGSHALCISKNISYRTSSPIVISYWSNLDSREAIPVPLPVPNPWSVSWNWIAAARQRLRIPVTVFQSNSTRLMPRNSPFPFGIWTTVCQAHSSARGPSQKAAWISPMTITHLEGTGNSYCIAALCQSRHLLSNILFFTKPHINHCSENPSY